MASPEGIDQVQARPKAEAAWLMCCGRNQWKGIVPTIANRRFVDVCLRPSVAKPIRAKREVVSPEGIEPSTNRLRVRILTVRPSPLQLIYSVNDGLEVRCFRQRSARSSGLGVNMGVNFTDWTDHHDIHTK